MLFYQVGELFSDYAVNKLEKVHHRADGYQPGDANPGPGWKEEKVDPYEVEIGDTDRR